VPAECLIEINNRYIWRSDWKQYYGPFTNQLKSTLQQAAVRGGFPVRRKDRALA